MGEIDYVALMPRVARHFWGEPNRKLSTNGELRWGSRGSKSVARGTWFDHEAGVGGGVLDLIMRQKPGYDRGDAAEWLGGQGSANGQDASPARRKAKAGRIV